MKTKTTKTPLMMSEAYGPTCCSFGLVPESKLSHHPKDQYGFVPKLSHHGGKYIALRAKKNWIAEISNRVTAIAKGLGFSVERSETMFLPRMMSYVAQQQVMMAGLVQELALKHKAMTSTRKLVELKHQHRCF